MRVNQSFIGALGAWNYPDTNQNIIKTNICKPKTDICKPLELLELCTVHHVIECENL